MKTRTLSEAALSLVGLAALAVYVLACTSFSPDDSQVLYPTYDTKAGDFGVGLYDRTTGRATTLFVAQQPASDGSRDDPALLRPQWLADGHHILLAWVRDASHDELDLAVLPHGQPGTTRFIHLEEIAEAGSQLVLPLAVADGRLFLQGESNALVRVDLRTGEIERRPMPRKVTPYALPAQDRVGYVAESEGTDQRRCEFGVINAHSFALERIARLPVNLDSDELGLCAISPEGTWVVVAANDGEEAGQIVLVEGDSEKRRWRPFAEADEVRFGYAAIAPLRTTAFVPFLRKTGGETNATLGIIEVSLEGGELRRTTLVHRVKGGELERVAYFQPSVSHDGKTLAVASTYVAAGDDQMAPEDCALFLVDLTDPQRKVTRVPVPRPPRELD